MNTVIQFLIIQFLIKRRLARAALLDRFQAQPTMEIGRWSREELYDD